MKKNRQIAGYIMFLSVGKPARIVTNMGTLQTSCVEHCIQHTDGRVWIETAHTKYTVLPY